jgi:carboxylate-amine ligase
VEEEFILLDSDGAAMPVAPDVVRLVDDEEIKAELMTYQVEVASGVCTELRSLEQQLVELRQRLAEAADRVGARLVASGVPPFDDPGLTLLTDAPRYNAMATHFPWAAEASGTCACHVHVGVDDRDLAVHILGRLRPFLPTLLAFTTNSPISRGEDTGWNSTRYSRQLRWPTFTPPGVWPSADAYDRVVDSLVRSGAALDLRSVYFLARLSPRYPTIEIRVADTCLHPEDAVLLAGVVRALVTALATDVRLGRPPVEARGPALQAQLLDVARGGAPAHLPAQRGCDTPPPAGPPGADGEMVDTLLRKIREHPESAADAEAVAAGLDRLRRVGTGAQRQRRMLEATGTPAQFTSAIAAATLSDAPTGPDEAAARE